MAIGTDNIGLKRDVRTLLTLVAFWVIVGIMFVYSSSFVFALEKHGSSYFFLKRHLVYLGIGLVCMIICAKIPLIYWRKFASLLFILSIFLTTLTLFTRYGLKMHGSNRWVVLGGFSFQPSEFMKLTLFLYLGALFDKKGLRIYRFFDGFVPCLLVLGIVFAILLKQPDLGSVITIFVTSALLFFVAAFKLNYLVGAVSVMIPVLFYLILTKSYRLMRILTFIDPWKDPQGKGFQIIQSLIAIGSGGFCGQGIANSQQKFFYLPMQHTDFIFSIIAEEVGFWGSFILVTTFCLFLFIGLNIVKKLHNTFSWVIALSFVIFIALQAFINISVALGMVPTKGLGLPFISYGGTALVSFLSMIGLIINVVSTQLKIKSTSKE